MSGRNHTTQNDCERTEARARETGQTRSRGDSGTGDAKEEGERGVPAGPRQRLRVWSRGAGRAARTHHERICRAVLYQISKVMLECSLWNTTSTVVGSPTGAPNARGIGDILSEEG